MKRILGIVTTLCLLYPFFVNASDQPVGNIKTLKGKASIIRNRNTLAVKIGSELYTNDSLKTGADGSLSIVFKDDTLISIGPDRRETVDCYQASQGNLSLRVGHYRQIISEIRTL
jgi:hypothetical protein